MLDDFMGKEVVVFYDDGASENNVKRKEGLLRGIMEGFVMLDEAKTGVRIMMPVQRVVRIEV